MGIGAFVRLVVGAAPTDAGVAPQAGRLPRARARATEPAVQQAGRSEGLVAQRFGGQAERRAARELCAMRVGLARRLRGARRLAEGRRTHDAPQHRAQAALRREVHRERIEQRLLLRRFAEHPEVLRGADQPASEALRPQPVDDDARWQRVVRGVEPGREPEAIAWPARVERQDRGGHVGGHGLREIGLVVGATAQHEACGRVRVRRHHHQFGDRVDEVVQRTPGGAQRVVGRAHAFVPSGEVVAERRGVGLPTRELCDLRGIQAAIEQRELVELAFGEAAVAVATAELEFAHRRGPLQVIAHDLGVDALAVEMEREARGAGAAVVRGDDLAPAAERERGLAADRRRRARPVVHELPVEVAVREQQLVSLGVGVLGVVARVQQDGTFLGALAPAPQLHAEGVLAAERRQSVDRDPGVAVERDRLAPRAGRAPHLGGHAGLARRLLRVDARSALDHVEREVRDRGRGDRLLHIRPPGLVPKARGAGRGLLHRGARVGERGSAVFHGRVDRAAQLADLRLLRLGGEAHRRLRDAARRIGIEPGFVDREEAAQRVVVALRDRVGLVVVAACAADRQAQERGAERVDAIGDVLVPPFLLDRAAFVGLAMQAPERRRGARLHVGVGKQVARDQLLDEPVPGFVGEERREQPVAPRPRPTLEVGLEPVGVREAREVEPGGGEVLRARLAGQQRVDATFVGVRSRIRQERGDVLG